MSKDSDAQSTPDWLFQDLHSIYGFILDAAANESNHKVDRWFGPGGEAEDALAVDWPTGREWIWLNPPYSRGNQRKFVEKAIEEAWKGSKTLALLPADTSTRLFHDCIWERYKVQFLSKRLKFNGSKSAAKFGSMLVEFCLREDYTPRVTVDLPVGVETDLVVPRT